MGGNIQASFDTRQYIQEIGENSLVLVMISSHPLLGKCLNIYRELVQCFCVFNNNSRFIFIAVPDMHRCGYLIKRHFVIS